MTSLGVESGLGTQLRATSGGCAVGACPDKILSANEQRVVLRCSNWCSKRSPKRETSWKMPSNMSWPSFVYGSFPDASIENMALGPQALASTNGDQ